MELPGECGHVVMMGRYGGMNLLRIPRPKPTTAAVRDEPGARLISGPLR